MYEGKDLHDLIGTSAAARHGVTTLLGDTVVMDVTPELHSLYS